jgi:hypothetical protein
LFINTNTKLSDLGDKSVIVLQILLNVWIVVPLVYFVLF